jgi:hypothetical protein
VRFVVEKVALRQGILQILWVLHIIIIPPMLQTHLNSNIFLSEEEAG